MGRRQKKRLLDKGYLFVGVSPYIYLTRKKNDGFFYQTRESGEFVTRVYDDILYAIANASTRFPKHREEPHVRPLLLAVRCAPYVGSMSNGRVKAISYNEGPNGIEIDGKIELEDLVLILSEEDLRGVYPNASAEVIKTFKETFHQSSRASDGMFL